MGRFVGSRMTRKSSVALTGPAGMARAHPALGAHGVLTPKCSPGSSCDKYEQVLRGSLHVHTPGPAPAETRGRPGLKYRPGTHL